MKHGKEIQFVSFWIELKMSFLVSVTSANPLQSSKHSLNRAVGWAHRCPVRQWHSRWLTLPITETHLALFALQIIPPLCLLAGASLHSTIIYLVMKIQRTLQGFPVFCFVFNFFLFRHSSFELTGLVWPSKDEIIQQCSNGNYAHKKQTSLFLRMPFRSSD